MTQHEKNEPARRSRAALIRASAWKGWAGITAAAAAAGFVWWTGPCSQAYAASHRVSQHTADKLVPILSAGTGLRVGAALVTGPSTRVGQTAAVAQIEVKWKNIVEARVMVPVSNPKVTGGISRVPEVSVYAVGNYRI